MIDDIFEQLSQRGSIAETAENFRIREVADELLRRSQLHEAQFRGSKEDVNAFEIEQRITEQYAKENDLWLSFDDISRLGVPGPSGNENDLYVSDDIVFKVNNLLNCGSILRFLDRLMWHNDLFYDTAYTLHGFAGFGGRSVLPVIRQRLIKNAKPATQIEIDTYMAAIGFERTDTRGSFENSQYVVWDLLSRNVLKDAEGDIYIVDAEISRKEIKIKRNKESLDLQ